jgi:hypothetical protein
MFGRLAGRLLTSPLAFLIAGLADFLIFAGATIRRGACSVTHRMLESIPKIARR